MVVDVVWIWGIVGLALLAAELALPGFYLLWLGLAALIVCAFTAVFDIALKAQLLLFGASAIATCVAGWFFYRGMLKSSPAMNADDVNEGAAQMLGSMGEVVEACVSGQIRVKVRDSVWLATGPDLAAGTRVRVVGQTGTVLRIEAAER
jgi:membrane protein implicated in regulation of membrane protease activity